jgi:hypothetical protein
MAEDLVEDSAFYSLATLATISYTPPITLLEKTMSQVVFQKFMQDLRAGEYDDNLGQVKDLIENRRQKLAQLNASAILPGSHVKIVGNIRPVYLVGNIAKVTKVNQSTVSISFLQPIYGTGGRSRPITDCRIPLTCVEPASKDEVDTYVKNMKPTGPTATRSNRWNGFNMVNDDFEIERRIARAEAQD